jgi:hypothetical protein
MGFLQRGMRSMNSVDLPLQFQVKVSEENPGAASDIAPEEHPNHPNLEPMRVVLYSRPSGVVAGKQSGTVRSALRKDLGTIERQDWETYKEHWKRLTVPDMQADDLEDIGILVGEVCDEKIIEECLHMGRNSINELLVNSNEEKKG